jgi:hypothetical protein
MSYTPLKVKYGTSVEPWHTLAPWYGLGQLTQTQMWGVVIYGSLGAAFAAGALTMHLMHKYRVLGMNRRPRRNRRR